MMWRDREQKNINLHVFASCCIVVLTVFVLKSLNEMRRSRSDRQLRLFWTSPQKSASISGSESQIRSSTDWWWFHDDVIKSKELVFVAVHDVLVGQDPQHFITSPMLIITSRGSSFYIYNHLDRSQRRDVKCRALFWFCSTCTIQTDKLERCFVLVLLGSIQTLCWISVWRTASDKCFGSRFEPFKNEGLDGSSFSDWMFRLRRSLCFHSLRVLNSGW